MTIEKERARTRWCMCVYFVYVSVDVREESSVAVIFEANSETERQRNRLTDRLAHSRSKGARTDSDKRQGNEWPRKRNNKNNATRTSEVKLEQRQGGCSMQHGQWIE